jgi:murein DD-endopeptidase MepM/ murein hydrolase activator NlpD
VSKNSPVEVVPGASRKLDWISGIAWLIALGALTLAVYFGWQRWAAEPLSQPSTPTPQVKVEPTAAPVIQARPEDLPGYALQDPTVAIVRRAALFTDIPNRPRQEVQEYTVEPGDSVFAIAGGFKISPETLLWSNYDQLKDNPHAISTGMVLKIPPTDGVYYQWQDGDTLESVASAFKTESDTILNWPGNRLDLTDPLIEAGTWVMVPGGQREFQQWIVPVMARGAAGVSTGVYGGGACAGGYEGLYGTGGFIWPTINHTISGNDYWSGHLAIDIGSAPGEPISAADAGVIVFAGWATGGYGNTVAIDHGNGYATLYGHLSSVIIGCGQSVRQGQIIGYGGSTGNSTGPHLHFEIRYQGGFVNPWYVLPAP